MRDLVIRRSALGFLGLVAAFSPSARAGGMGLWHHPHKQQYVLTTTTAGAFPGVVVPGAVVGGGIAPVTGTTVTTVRGGAILPSTNVPGLFTVPNTPFVQYAAPNYSYYTMVPAAFGQIANQNPNNQIQPPAGSALAPLSQTQTPTAQAGRISGPNGPGPGPGRIASPETASSVAASNTQNLKGRLGQALQGLGGFARNQLFPLLLQTGMTIFQNEIGRTPIGGEVGIIEDLVKSVLADFDHQNGGGGGAGGNGGLIAPTGGGGLGVGGGGTGVGGEGNVTNDQPVQIILQGAVTVTVPSATVNITGGTNAGAGVAPTGVAPTLPPTPAPSPAPAPGGVVPPTPAPGAPAPGL